MVVLLVQYNFTTVNQLALKSSIEGWNLKYFVKLFENFKHIKL